MDIKRLTTHWNMGLNINDNSCTTVIIPCRLPTSQQQVHVTIMIKRQKVDLFLYCV